MDFVQLYTILNEISEFIKAYLKCSGNSRIH